jgi:hypothetical protein
MKNTKKLIVGAVVVLGAYYLYSKNKVKNEVEDLKEGADYPAPPTPLPTPTPVPTTSTEIKNGSITLADDVGKKFSNFDGKKQNSFSTTF